ncbi:MAG TPA: hypothetical protein VKB73_03060 [Gaiellaceae bacterium]|nr:hypothetical protein [Gaiellaceae bacterium]
MSAAASPFLAANLANELAYNGNVPRSYDLAYEQWLSRSGEVQAQLQTYFPDARGIPGVPNGGEWSSFSFRMRDLYYFFRLSRGKVRASDTRANYVGRLEEFVTARHQRDCPNEFCEVVDFRSIDRWLAAPRRSFDDVVNFNLEELINVFKVDLYDLEEAVLRTSPRL